MNEDVRALSPDGRTAVPPPPAAAAAPAPARQRWLILAVVGVAQRPPG
jgi:hypothetical protein